MRTYIGPVVLSIALTSAARAEDVVSHFECKDLGSGKFRPFYLQANAAGTAYKDWSQTPKGLLGQNAMTTTSECQAALDAANDEFGVICSRTGLDGWKPTIYTGTSPGRADFGYLGGSSIVDFDDCLKATSHSSADGVCFWGGSSWYVSPIDHEGNVAGPFSTIDACARYTRGTVTP